MVAVLSFRGWPYLIIAMVGLAVWFGFTYVGAWAWASLVRFRGGSVALAVLVVGLAIGDYFVPGDSGWLSGFALVAFLAPWPASGLVCFGRGRAGPVVAQPSATIEGEDVLLYRLTSLVPGDVAVETVEPRLYDRGTFRNPIPCCSTRSHSRSPSMRSTVGLAAIAAFWAAAVKRPSVISTARSAPAADASRWKRATTSRPTALAGS